MVEGTDFILHSPVEDGSLALAFTRYVPSPPLNTASLPLTTRRLALLALHGVGSRTSQRQ